MLGAPFGACIGCGNAARDSRTVRPITPLNSGGNGGSRSGASAARASADKPKVAAAATQKQEAIAATPRLVGIVLVMGISISSPGRGRWPDDADRPARP